MSEASRQGAVPQGSSPGTPADETIQPAQTSTPVADQRKLPGWLDHFNARDLKVLFRCSVAAWVASLLIFIGPSHDQIGTATFFATLVLFIVPPSGIVFIFILAALTLLIGIGLAWAWGTIVMKAALAARPSSDTEATLQALGKQAYSQANATGQPVAAVEQKLIYDGWMLDARVSAVYFSLICLFIYVLARVRAKNPKFTITQIFGTIIADLFLTLGPLLPAFNGTLPKLLIEPAAIGIGIGLACCLIFFPKSTSHTVLAGFEGLVRLLKTPLDFTLASLAKEGDPLILKSLRKNKARTIGAYRSIEPALGFLPLDFGLGWWNADDIRSLREPIRQALVNSVALLELHIARLSGATKLEKLDEIIAGHHHDSDTEPGNSEQDEKKKKKNKKKPHEVGMRQLLETGNLVNALRSPEHESIRLETIEAIRDSSRDILPACQEATETVASVIHVVNSARWFGRPSKQNLNEALERSQATLQALQAARNSFATEATERLIQTYGDMFDESGKLKSLEHSTSLSVRGIMIGMVYEEHVLGVADSWEKVLSQITALLKERQKIQLWLPKGLRYAVNWVSRRNAVAPVIVAQGSETDPDIAESQSKAAQQRLRISRGYRVKRRNGLGRAILSTYHWLINPDGMYALRMVAVTIALGIPAVIPSSAGFYFREKGLWGLIMGQTTMLIYMADFTFSVISRAIGTIVGGILGLLAWYIGSGNGPGNPYGLAAIMAVVIVVLMWGRLFAPPALLQACMMGGATCILVVGYSYDDTHIPQYGNPGIGYNVFWRRLVLVVIGFAAAIIVQLFPRPPSASRHICKSLSNVIRSLSDHYALLLSSWGQSDGNAGLVAEKIALDLGEKLNSLNGPIGMLRFEFSGSPFDSDRLAQVKTLSEDMNRSVARLLYLSASLPEYLQARLSRYVGLLDHRNIGDIMAVLGVVEQALKTGDPLPEVLPTPLLKRCYEFWQSRHVDIVLSTETIRDENYRKFCVALNSYLKFLAAIDDLVLVMKGTLGESHIVSRELTHDEYEV
ncbi:hypothetical protein N7474_001891 [Penicillium riverlandense]|uniref:uncharacterized protein n=1 Tax=Penicillium riverlandense TaxID=1903569 RepID=UPI002546ADE2|nr:uncharacterized protein N7474_001891 [Penicillium riverlandense]KAJ5833580.1 hypothetical protein N7474_001891 [Penicillium riverlandense]